MSCINYYLLKRILDITCGNVLITLLCLSPIIIWSGRIFCTECYLRIPTRCMCRCMFYILVYACIFRRIAQFTRCIAGLLTKLMFVFVLIFMLLSLSAFVRLLLKKLLACLLNFHRYIRRMTTGWVKIKYMHEYFCAKFCLFIWHKTMHSCDTLCCIYLTCVKLKETQPSRTDFTTKQELILLLK